MMMFRVEVYSAKGLYKGGSSSNHKFHLSFNENNEKEL